MVVVLSAMSGETDRLTGLAHAIQKIPDLREMDMLLATGEQTTVALFAMAVKEAGVNAVSLLGDQVAIHTDALKPGARVVSHRFTMGDWEPNTNETITVGGEDFLIPVWIIGQDNKK